MPNCNSRCACVIESTSSVTVEGSGRGEKPYRLHAAGVGGAGGSGWEPGDLKWSARSVAPNGWLVADGSPVSRTQYADLYEAIGDAFGDGDGVNTFNLPNYLGRFAMGADPQHPVGSSGGTDGVTIKAENLPQHTHTMNHRHTGLETAGGNVVEWASNALAPGGTAGIRASGEQGLRSGAYSGNTGAGGGVANPTPVQVIPPYTAALPLIKT